MIVTEFVFTNTKAELPLEGIFFEINFLPWEFLLIKNVGNQKN